MQVEAEMNTKSQVTGVRKSSDDMDSSNTRRKRRKIVAMGTSSDENLLFGTISNLENSSRSHNENDSFMTLEENVVTNSNENGFLGDSYTNGSFNNDNQSISDGYLNNGSVGEMQNNPNEMVSNLQQVPTVNNGEGTYNIVDGEIMDSDIQYGIQTRSSTTLEMVENEHFFKSVDSTSGSRISPQKDLLSTSQKDLPSSPQKDLPSIPQKGLFSSSQKNLPSSLQNDILSTLQKETITCSQKELSSSKKSFDENIDTDDILEPHSSKELSLRSSSQKDVTHSTLSEAETVNTVNKEDIKYLGIYDLKATQLEGHADVVFCVSADENVVISSSGDTTVKVWNVENSTELSNFAGHSDAVTAIILLSPEQSKLLGSKLDCSEVTSIAVSASMDCHVKVWSVSDGKEISSIYTYNSITCMDCLHSELCVVIGTEGGKLEVWDLSAGKKVESVFAHESSVSCLKVEDSYVYSTSSDGVVKVWLFDDGEELRPLYSRRRRATSSTGTDLGPTHWKAVAVSKDNLFLGDDTPYLKTLNWRIGRLNLFTNQLGRAGVCDAVLIKDNILLSTFYNSTKDLAGINVWALPDMTYVGTLTGDVQDIYCLAVTRSENRLRIVSGGHQLIVWDFNLKEPSKESSGNPFHVCEIEGLGTEVNDASVKPSTPGRSVPLSKQAADKENEGRCNII